MRSTLTTHTRIGCKPRPYGRYARIWLLTWLALQAAIQSQEHKSPPAIAPATNHHDSDTSHDVTASSVVSNDANADIELTADTSLSLLALASELPAKSKSTTFDTDSVPIKIDNCASACITNSLDDFVSPPKRVRATVGGIGGPVQAMHKGTI